MNAVLYSEINVLAIVILVILILKSSFFDYDKSGRHIYFVWTAYFSVASNFFDIAWHMGVTEYWTAPVWLVKVEVILYFLTFICSILSFYLYSEAFLGKEKPSREGSGWKLTFPIALLAVLCVVSLDKNVIFFFDEKGVYNRGKYFLIQPALTYSYTFFVVAKSLKMAARKEHYVIQNECLRVVLFNLPIFICGVLQLFDSKFPLATLGPVVSLILVYIRALENLISLDPLTGISNRRELLNYLEQKVSSLKPNERLFFFFIDVDNFKNINDVFGHNEGDKALKFISDILKDISEKRNCFCSRYGGDEFALVKITQNGREIPSFCDGIRKTVERKSKEVGMAYDVRVSIGYSEYSFGDSIKDLILRADAEMYNDKKNKRNFKVKDAEMIV